MLRKTNVPAQHRRARTQTKLTILLATKSTKTQTSKDPTKAIDALRVTPDEPVVDLGVVV